MLKTIRKHGFTLALFAAGSTGLTAAINQPSPPLMNRPRYSKKRCSIRFCLAIATIITCLKVVIWSMRQRWAKVRTVYILPARTIVLLLRFLKLRRQMVIPGRFNCWWVSISRVPCWVRGLPNTMKRLGWAIKSNCDCPTGSPILAVKQFLRITPLTGQ